MEGIQQLFHELMGYEEYQQDLFTYLLRKREAAKQWQADNAPKAREYARKSMARKYATDETYRERHKRAVLARQKDRYRNDPAFAERMRQYARDRYARLKEARAA